MGRLGDREIIPTRSLLVSKSPCLLLSKSMFDPNLPANNVQVRAAELRGQFNGLKTLIDAIQGGITSVAVDDVNTLPAGSSATVGLQIIGSELRFTFGIPQGEAGPTGATGQPGEVSQTDLNNAMQNTLSMCSANSNSVGMLSMSAEPGYDQSQMQAVMQKIDELINALRR